DVADHAAAQGEQHALAVHAAAYQLAGEVGNGGQRLVALAVGHLDEFRGKTCGREGRGEGVAPMFANRRDGQCEVARLVGEDLTQRGAGAREESGFNIGGIRPGRRVDIYTRHSLHHSVNAGRGRRRSCAAGRALITLVGEELRGLRLGDSISVRSELWRRLRTKPTSWWLAPASPVCALPSRRPRRGACWCSPSAR